MAHAELQIERPDLEPGRGAVRAAQVEIEDHLGPVAANVVAVADRRNGGAGELGVQRSRASKIRFAPGISRSDSEACDHSTVPSGPTRTRERLLKPRSSR
jgi:hypothetical protein